MAALWSGYLASIKDPGPERLWEVFAKTRFVEKLNKTYGLYFFYPEFTGELRSLEGKQVELKGFYIPLELQNDRTVILSKYPMAECFFCGGAGPESVAVVYFKTKPSRRLKMDQIIHVKGALRLNATDVEEMTFILEDAELIN